MFIGSINYKTTTKIYETANCANFFEKFCDIIITVTLLLDVGCRGGKKIPDALLFYVVICLREHIFSLHKNLQQPQRVCHSPSSASSPSSLLQSLFSKRDADLSVKVSANVVISSIPAIHSNDANEMDGFKRYFHING